MIEQTVSYLIKSFLLLLSFYLLYSLFLRKEKVHQFNRYYLLMGIIISTAFPLIHINISNAEFSNSFLTESYLEFNISELVQKYTSAGTANLPPDNTEGIISLSSILITIYILVSSFLLLRFLFGLLRIYMIYRKSPIHKKEDHTLVYIENDFTPFSFFHYIFINMQMAGTDELHTIIKHELVHKRNAHSIDNILLEIFSIILWFNPLIWIIKKDLKNIHEFQADEKVIAQGFEFDSYFSFLLNQIIGKDAMGFTNRFNKSLIKRRILMVKNLRSAKMALLKILIIIPVTFLLVASTTNINRTENSLNARNLLSFSTDGDKIPNGWYEAGSNLNQYECKVDETVNLNGKKTLLIESLNPTGDRDFGNVMQTISADEYRGKRVKISCDIKVEKAVNGAAIWMRIDGRDQKKRSLGFDNMAKRMPKGNADWQNYNIVLDIPENAFSINYGMMLMQKGKAWFANFNFEVVDSSTEVTNSRRSLPQEPVNLDFD